MTTTSTRGAEGRVPTLRVTTSPSSPPQTLHYSLPRTLSPQEGRRLQPRLLCNDMATMCRQKLLAKKLMVPTKEEEIKLRHFKEETSPIKHGPAKKLLKAVLDVPFACTRLDTMLIESEVNYLKNDFDILDASCVELRNTKLFMKLTEAILKTDIRMNVGMNRGETLSSNWLTSKAEAEVLRLEKLKESKMKELVLKNQIELCIFRSIATSMYFRLYQL